jgi:hypothetical protein
MNRDVHPAGPAADLLAVVEIQVPLWFRRIIEQAARAGGADPKLLSTEIDLLVANEALRLVDALRDLLFTDVDEQRTNPLTLFRRAVSAPTALLRDAGVPQPARDGFAADRFPDDVYRLGPANWSEVSPVLHDPGIAWGAWKAMTILERRRAAGLR